MSLQKVYMKLGTQMYRPYFAETMFYKVTTPVKTDFNII